MFCAPGEVSFSREGHPHRTAGYRDRGVPGTDRAALDLDRAADILDGDKYPTDPSISGTANPGHGTGTASVVISREAGVMVGSAPEATLVPIRCTTDVKIFDGTPVAAAIEHATRVGCDVITMSLGGLPVSRFRPPFGTRSRRA